MNTRTFLAATSLSLAAMVAPGATANAEASLGAKPSHFAPSASIGADQTSIGGDRSTLGGNARAAAQLMVRYLGWVAVSAAV